jgi:hypothetical protein
MAVPRQQPPSQDPFCTHAGCCKKANPRSAVTDITELKVPPVNTIAMTQNGHAKLQRLEERIFTARPPRALVERQEALELHQASSAHQGLDSSTAPCLHHVVMADCR